MTLGNTVPKTNCVWNRSQVFVGSGDLNRGKTSYFVSGIGSEERLGIVTVIWKDLVDPKR